MESKSQYGSRIACEGIQNSIDRLYKSIQDYLKRSKEEKIMKNKNWEILTYESKDGRYLYDLNILYPKNVAYRVRNESTGFSQSIFTTENSNIYSVKRLSDGEVFTIGDKVTNFGYYDCSSEIRKIEVSKDDLIILNGSHWCCELNCATRERKSIKPPLGIIPRKLWIEQRILELNSAILRYKEVGKEWPKEWDEESIKLIAEKYEISEIKINGFYNQSGNWCCTDKEEEKKEWKIISYKNDGSNIIWNCNGKGLMSYGGIIHSVKRLSDGEVFTIGDRVAMKNADYSWDDCFIKEFKQDTYKLRVVIKQRDTCSDYPLDNDLLKVTKKISLFTTEDGVEIFEGDEFYILYREIQQEQIANKLTKRNPECLYFSKIEFLNEYLLMNKPINLSLNDIKDSYEYNQTWLNLKNKLISKLK